jgi:GntR family transcriptional regulator, rspAB operon transcriptional repressor
MRPTMSQRFKFPPGQTTNKTQIRDYLRKQIVSAELPPGARLSENELAQEIGTSRTPVREAIQVLQREGLIEVRPQSGSYVAPIDMQSLRSNYMVRETLECRLVEEAARNCGEADARNLERIIARQKECQASNDDKAFFDSDEALHECLMQIAGHPKVWEIVHSAKAHLDRVRYLAVRDPVSVARIIRDHEAIVAAVRARDPGAASTAMRNHLSNVFQVIDRVKAEHSKYFVE